MAEHRGFLPGHDGERYLADTPKGKGRPLHSVEGVEPPDTRVESADFQDPPWRPAHFRPELSSASNVKGTSMPQDHTLHDATNRPHVGRLPRRPGRCTRLLAGLAAMALSLPAVAGGQRQMHDAKAALAMLEDLRVEDGLSADDPGCDRYVRQDYDSNRPTRPERPASTK